MACAVIVIYTKHQLVPALIWTICSTDGTAIVLQLQHLCVLLNRYSITSQPVDETTRRLAVSSVLLISTVRSNLSARQTVRVKLNVPSWNLTFHLSRLTAGTTVPKALTTQ